MELSRRHPFCILVIAAAFCPAVSGAVTKHLGTLGSASVPTSYQTATAGQGTEFIDFDNDGFNLAAHTFTPIPINHYALQRVQLLQLDARSVGGEPWAHSPPNGAWHTGFSTAITTPYSFVFSVPVASFGLFANDVEGSVSVSVTTTTGTQSFVLPVQGGASITRFHGFTSPTNTIRRIDFFSTDYHIVDDVRFGYVPEPASLISAAAMGLLVMRRR